LVRHIVNAVNAHIFFGGTDGRRRVCGHAERDYPQVLDKAPSPQARIGGRGDGGRNGGGGGDGVGVGGSVLDGAGAFPRPFFNFFI